MRTCPDCGRELAPGEKRCPLCGAAVPEPVPPALGETLDELADQAVPSSEGSLSEGGTSPAVAEETKPRRRAVVFVPIAVACAVVLGLAVWLVSGLLKSPDKGFLAAHWSLFRSIAQTELAPFIPDAAETVNADMLLTAQLDHSVGATAAVLNNAALRVQAEGGKDGGILTAALELGENTVLEATVTGNKDGILGFYIPQLSETYYTMDYVQFAENNGGGQSAVNDTPAAGAWGRMLKTYGGILGGMINKENVTKQKGTFTSFYLPEAQYPGTAYVFTPTAEELETMFTQLADALEEDETLHALFNARAYGDGDDPLDKLVDALRADGEEAARSIADSGFTWTIRTGKGNYGVNAQIELVWDNGESAIRFDRLSNAVYFGVVENGETTVELSASYHQAEDGTWHGSAGMTGAGDVEWESVDLDAPSSLRIYPGHYAVLGATGGTVVSMDVTPAAGGGTDHTVKVMPDENGDTLTTLNLHTTDQPVSLTFPDAPREDITGYTAGDFERLRESWSAGISALATQFILYAYQQR